MNLPIINHDDYVAKINDDNKFPIKKFGELANYLINEGITKKFIQPKFCSVETLSKAHSLDYINTVSYTHLTLPTNREV